MLSKCGAGKDYWDYWLLLDCKDIKPGHPKGNQPWISIGRTDAEAPILWPPDVNSQLIGKDPGAGKNWRQEEKRGAEDELVGWHRRFNGHELGQTPGDSERQGDLACCSSWGRKELDTTEWLNSTKLIFHIIIILYLISYISKFYETLLLLFYTVSIIQIYSHFLLYFPFSFSYSSCFWLISYFFYLKKISL